MSTKKKAITFYADEETAAWYDALPVGQARSQVINRMIALGRQFEGEGAELASGLEDRIKSIEEWIAWAGPEIIAARGKADSRGFYGVQDPSDAIVKMVPPKSPFYNRPPTDHALSVPVVSSLLSQLIQSVNNSPPRNISASPAPTSALEDWMRSMEVDADGLCVHRVCAENCLICQDRRSRI